MGLKIGNYRYHFLFVSFFSEYDAKPSIKFKIKMNKDTLLGKTKLTEIVNNILELKRYFFRLLIILHKLGIIWVLIVLLNLFKFRDNLFILKR